MVFTQAKLVYWHELFFSTKSQILLRQNVFILKVFSLRNNQLLSTANAKDNNTDGSTVQFPPSPQFDLGGENMDFSGKNCEYTLDL